MNHGDVTRDGDEFNRSTWYYCAKCGTSHARELPQCDGLRGGWPPSVPTGFVPWPGGLVVLPDPYGDALERGKRVGELIDKLKRPPRCPGCGSEDGVLHHPGCLQKVVDDYLLMERKARAWDALYQQVELNWEVDRMDKLLADAHPAQGSSTS